MFWSVEFGVERSGYGCHPLCGRCLDLGGRVCECWDVAPGCPLLESVEKILCVTFSLFLPLDTCPKSNPIQFFASEKIQQFLTASQFLQGLLLLLPCRCVSFSCCLVLSPSCLKVLDRGVSFFLGLNARGDTEIFDFLFHFVPFFLIAQCSETGLQLVGTLVQCSIQPRAKVLIV